MTQQSRHFDFLEMSCSQAFLCFLQGELVSKGDFGLRMLQIAQSFFEILLFL